MRKLKLLGAFVFIGYISVNAQNPLKQYGYDKEFLTLSNGQFNEFFYNDTVVQVGTVLFNTITNKIVAFIEEGNNTYSFSKGDVSRWLSVDPWAEKYYSWTPYKFCYNNPILFVDPDGRGEFIDNKGNVIGNDGIDDNKVYAMKTTQKDFDSKANSAGISKKDYKSTVAFIKSNSGNSDAFSGNNTAYSNSVEIEGSQDTRQAMSDAVSQDNGRGGTDANNNREYGGAVDKNGNVTVATPGDVANPSVQSEASVTITTTSNTNSTFHSHPSGSVVVGGNSNSSGASTSIGGTTTTYSFAQAPSQTDIRNAGSHTGYVFGKGNNTVYIYNSSGVVATIPMNRFVNFKR